MHSHTSKHQKRRRADAVSADRLSLCAPRGSTVRFDSLGPTLHANGAAIPVRSLDAARKACARAGMQLQVPLVQRIGPTPEQVARRLKWRAEQELSWASRKARA